MFNTGQIILVTGASSGIGKAIAQKCVEYGATVIACGKNEDRLAQAAEECVDPGRWISVSRDLLVDINSLTEWIKGLSKVYGRFWGLVCCAGAGIMDTCRTFSFEESRHLFDLNFNVPILLAKGIIDRRVHIKGGGIIFISSAAGIFPEKGHLLYGATKAALTCAAKSLSEEVAPLHLRVNCLAPGIVDSPMEKEAEQFMGSSYREEQLKSYPFGFGMPEDIAEMACFLLSEKARWITGQNIVMAGGRY